MRLCGFRRRRVAQSVVLAAASLICSTRSARTQEAAPAAPAGATSPVPVSRAATSDSPTTVDAHDPIAAATREYHASGVARTVIEGNFVTFPFGHAQAHADVHRAPRVRH